MGVLKGVGRGGAGGYILVVGWTVLEVALGSKLYAMGDDVGQFRFSCEQ